jgi:hypothetical protein
MIAKKTTLKKIKELFLMNKPISLEIYKSLDTKNLLSVKKWINNNYEDDSKLFNDSNNPINIYDLSLEKIVILVEWINKSFLSCRNKCSISSYGLKHVFENSKNGFYINNGMVKGAMLMLGFTPLNSSCTNFNYKIKYVCGVAK